MKLPVWIPKFKFESEVQLEGLLSALGMPTAFDQIKADFSGIDGIQPGDPNEADRLFVERGIHKAVIEVDEQGTEAAATTTVVLKSMERPPPDPPKFRADHPFLFLIRHDETGLILFLGRVADPSKS